MLLPVQVKREEEIAYSMEKFSRNEGGLICHLRVGLVTFTKANSKSQS